MQDKEKFKLMYIKWEDASGADGWIHIDKVRDAWKLAVIHSIGYLVHEDKKSYTLSMCVSESLPHIGAYMSIPKSCVVSKKVLAHSVEV